MRHKMVILTLALALLGIVGGAALANGGPEKPREVLGSGVSDSTAPGVSLQATLGQPVVGVVASSGGVSLGQGFWHGGSLAAGGHRVYLPLIQKQATGG